MHRITTPFRCLVLLASFLLAACASEGVEIEVIDGVTYVRNDARIDTTNFPYRFVLEQTYGVDNEPEEAMIGRASGIVLGQDEEVYVLDTRSNQVLAFDPDGNLLWRAGHEGEGPGEFMQPRGMVLAGDSALIIGNQGSAVVDFWSLEGEFIDSRAVPEETGSFPGVAHMTSDGELVLSGFQTGSMGTLLSTVDVNAWSVVDSTFISQDIGREMPRGFLVGQQITFTDNGFLAGSSSQEYAIWQYDELGRLKREISRDVDFLNGVGVAQTENRATMRQGSWLNPMPTMESGELLVFVSWTDYPDMDELARLSLEGEAPETNRFSAVDLFDRDGRYIKSRIWDEEEFDMGGFQFISGDKLYTTTDTPFPQVRRYRIEPR